MRGVLPGLLGGAVVAALLPLGSTIGWWGDGIDSDTACPGLRNGPIWTLIYLCGRVLPGPLYNQCQSGGEMDTTYARRDAAISQQWDIAVFANQGHNDNLMSTDALIDPTQFNKWTRNLDAWIAGNPSALYIPVIGTIPSDVGTETNLSSDGVRTRRAVVQDMQAAYVAAKVAADSRIEFISTTDWVPSANSTDSGNANTHPDERGGYKRGYDYYGPKISARLTAATKDQIQTMLLAGTYPGLTPTNYDTNPTLAGSNSGATNLRATPTPAPTGFIANLRRLQNNLGGTSSVVASKDASPGTYEKQVIALTGTPAAANSVIFDTTTAFTATGSTPGQYVYASIGLRIDNGAGGPFTALQNLSFAWGSFGTLGTIAAPAQSAGVVPRVIDTILFGAARPIFGAATGAAFPLLGLRFAATSLGETVTVDRPALHRASQRTKTTMKYIGNDTIQGVAAQLRVTGTIAAGFRVDPGSYNMPGLTEADFVERRIYKGGTTVINSGTLLTTMSGSTWTTATTPAGYTAGDSLWAEITDRDGGISRSPVALVAA